LIFAFFFDLLCFFFFRPCEVSNTCSGNDHARPRSDACGARRRWRWHQLRGSACAILGPVRSRSRTKILPSQHPNHMGEASCSQQCAQQQLDRALLRARLHRARQLKAQDEHERAEREAKSLALSSAAFCKALESFALGEEAEARRESSAAIPRELPRERRCLSTTTTTTTSMYLARQIRAASAIKRCESKRLSERRQVMGVGLDSTVAGAAAAAAWRLPRRRVGPHSLCAPSAAATRSIARASTLG
jgi:hypothetical protein